MDELIYQLKDSVLPTIIAIGIIVFLLTGITYGGAVGIFDVIGEVPTAEDTDTKIHTTPGELDNFLEVEMPEIKVSGNVYSARTEIVVGSMFTVTKDGVTYTGTQGDAGGFAILLTEVTNANGDEVMEEMTMDEYEQLEEVPYSVIYDEEQDILYFTQSGVYDLYLTCKLDSGVNGKFIVSIPVKN